MTKRKSVRFRRFLAVCIDLAILCLASFLLTQVLRIPFLGYVAVFLSVFSVIGLLVFFVLRDYLFQGRSIGKRFCGLVVLDAATQAPPTGKQLVIKGLFFFLSSIDALLLLFSGKSIGERVSHTVVARQFPEDEPQQVSAATTKKRLAFAGKIALVASVAMFLLMSVALSIVKKQDNYQIAYTYLVESDAFADTQAEQSQIILTGYSASTKWSNNDPTTETHEVTFTFLVQGRQYKVTCHKDGDGWYVCNECTPFQ